PAFTCLPLFCSLDPAPPALYPLSLHDALPISRRRPGAPHAPARRGAVQRARRAARVPRSRRRPGREAGVRLAARSVLDVQGSGEDRKSTRLNSSHVKISYAVFCLKKKKKKKIR